MKFDRQGKIEACPAPARRRVTRLVVLLALSIVSFVPTQPVQSEVRISGNADALTLEVQDATLEQVLAALRLSFQFNYRSAKALGTATDGRFNGPLPRVVTRILEGHDYVMHRSSSGLQVDVFDSSPPAQAAPTRAVSAKPSAKECQYKDGDRIIPVEC